MVIRKWHPLTWLSLAVGCIAVCFVLARDVHGEVERRRHAARRCRALLTEIAKAKQLYARVIDDSDDAVMSWGYFGEANSLINFDSKYWPCRAEGRVTIGRLGVPVRCEKHGAVQGMEMPTSPSTRTQ